MNFKINKYPDGTSYVTIPKEWEDTTQELIFKLNSYEDLIHLCQLCDVLIYNRVKAHIVIPCLIEGQADRRFTEFQSSGLAIIARILEPYCNGKDISFGVFHPHNPEVTEALFTSVEILDNSEFIIEVLDDISNPEAMDVNNWRDNNNLILMSSDAGGFKPLIKLCEKINWKGDTHSCSKSRKYIKGKSELIQITGRDNFHGKDILIIDDICVYGGTFKGLAKKLRESNCGKLYLAVSHMTTPNLGYDPVTDYFDMVFTTNSKYYEYYHYKGQGNDKIMGVIPSNLKIIDLWTT